MDAKTKKVLEKSYAAYSRAELEDTLARAKAFLAAPGDASAETIQGANDTIEFITAVLAEPPVEEIEAPTAPKKNDREAAIVGRMAASGGSLNRAQAEIAVDHQIENDKQKAAEAKAAAMKK